MPSEKLIFQGQREANSTSANPGHIINMVIDLVNKGDMEMVDITVFSDEEIEEIDAYKDLVDSPIVNGEIIICFEILSSIIHGNMLINDISIEQLETASR